MSWRSGQAYSQDLRERVLGADGTVREVGDDFAVSASFVSKVRTRLARTGERTARSAGRGPTLKLAAHGEILTARVAAVPDATLEELREWLRSERGVSVSIGCLWNMLIRLRLTRKKRRSMRPSRAAPTLPARAQPGARASRR